MARRHTRRHFLRTAAATGAALGVGGFAALGPLGPANADEARVDPDLIRFSPEIEPVVKLIVETPREKCVAVMIEQLRAGLPYPRLLAALYLTAVRAADYHAPLHPFDHNAYSIYSANQLSLELPLGERLLPVFWALDALKGSLQQPPKPPTLALRGALPGAGRVADDLCAGIEERDRDRAERAVVALVRTQGQQRVTELLLRYAGRDRFFIGHLAILTANSLRLLNTIGWQHAEPVLRYVVGGLSGVPKDESDLHHHAENRERARKAIANLPADWGAGEGDSAFTKDLLLLIRGEKAAEACNLTAERLTAGKAKAGAVWDAVLLGAGEIVMSAQKNGGPLHANTAANALRYAFGASGNPETRFLILLQSVGWTAQFRKSIAGWPKDHKDILTLEASAVPNRPEAAAEEILATLSNGTGPGRANAVDAVPGWHGGERNVQPWRYEAAGKALGFARRFPGSEALRQAAVRLVTAKADGDPHRVKFPVAMLENLGWVSEPWRPAMLAAATYSFLGADAPDTDVVKQAREAVRNF